MTSVATRTLSLRKNFSWTIIGNVVYAACQWGMVVLMAKLGSAQTVGEFSLALALTTPVYMLTNLQLRAIQSTDARGQNTFGHYLGLRIWSSVIAMLVLAVLVAIGRYPLDSAVIIMLMSASKFLESISDAIFGLVQKHEQMDRIAISFILKGVISLAALTVLLKVTENLMVAVAGFAISGLIVLLTYDLTSARRIQARLQPVFSFKLLWPLIKLSFPLGVVMMLVSLNSNIPRYFIENTQGNAALGYFSTISYFIVAGNTVVNALGQSASPRLARYYLDENMVAFRRLLLNLIMLGIAVGLLGIVAVLIAGKYILSILYTPEYAAYSHLFFLVMIAACVMFLGSLIGYAMTAMRLIKVQSYLSVVMTLSSLLFSWKLIPTFGLDGAAYSLLFTSLIQVLGAMSIVLYELKMRNLRMGESAYED